MVPGLRSFAQVALRQHTMLALPDPAIGTAEQHSHRSGLDDTLDSRVRVPDHGIDVAVAVEIVGATAPFLLAVDHIVRGRRGRSGDQRHEQNAKGERKGGDVSSGHRISLRSFRAVVRRRIGRCGIPRQAARTADS
jgi:hypothetical protein